MANMLNKNTKKQNNNSSTTIKYKGNVTIKYVDKTGKPRQVSKHNEGKLGLFTFLSLCLAGAQKTAQIYAPSRLGLYNQDDSTLVTTALSNFIPYYSSPKTYYQNSQGQWIEGTDNCSKVVYSFLVTPQSLNSSSSDITTCNLLRLVSSNYTNNESSGNSDKYLCAEMQLLNTPTQNGTLNEQIQLDGTSNILIYWELTFE